MLGSPRVSTLFNLSSTIRRRGRLGAARLAAFGALVIPSPHPFLPSQTFLPSLDPVSTSVVTFFFFSINCDLKKNTAWKYHFCLDCWIVEFFWCPLKFCT